MLWGLLKYHDDMPEWNFGPEDDDVSVVREILAVIAIGTMLSVFWFYPALLLLPLGMALLAVAFLVT